MTTRIAGYGVNGDPLDEGKLDLPELLEAPTAVDWAWAREFIARRKWREGAEMKTDWRQRARTAKRLVDSPAKQARKRAGACSMDEKVTAAALPGDPSADEMLALMYKKGTPIEATPLPAIADLGPKGEKRFYVLKDTVENQAIFASFEAGESLPEGATEITWEQACEMVVRLEANADHVAKLGELLEGWEGLYRQQNGFGARLSEFKELQERSSRKRAYEGRAASGVGWKGILWLVLGHQSMQASRAFGRWINQGR